MKFGIRILPKKGFLDPQGRAVEALLKTKVSEVQSVHIGKWIELDINDPHPESAFAKAHQMAKDVLTNQMTESYELERLNP